MKQEELSAKAIAILYLRGEIKYVEAVRALMIEAKMTGADAKAFLTAVVDQE